MIKVALYGLVRVLFDWVGIAAALVRRRSCSPSGRSRRSAGFLYALFQHELKRLLALHSIENVGIIVLGLGACARSFARAGEPTWAAFAFGAALLHTAQPRRLQVAALPRRRARSSAPPARSSSTGWAACCAACRGPARAFLVGAAAIAGLPPLNGFASEWLTLQALLHVPPSAALGIGIAGASRSRRSPATAALAVFCFVKVVGLVLLGAAAPAERRRPPRSAGAMRAAPSSSLALACVVLGLASRACCSRRSSASRPGRPAQPAGLGLHLPGTGSLPTLGIAARARRADARRCRLLRRRAAAPRRRRRWACGQRVEPALALDERRASRKPLRLVLEAVLRPEREIAVQRERRRGPGRSPTAGESRT